MSRLPAYLQERLAALGPGWASASRETSVVLVTPQHVTSRSVVAVVVARETGRPSLVVKMPRLAQPSPGLAREASILARLEREQGDLLDTIPRVLAYLDEPGQQQLLIETALDGPALDERIIRGDASAWLGRVDVFLEALPHSSSRDVAAAHERLIRRPLEEFAARHSDAEDVEGLVAESLELVSPLRDANMQLVLEHGDLRHPNLIRMPGERLGVVDWELAEPDGLPLSDLFAFLGYVAVALRKATTPSQKVRALSNAFGRDQQWVQQAVSRHARRLQLDASLVTPLFVACWARYGCGLTTRAASKADPTTLSRAILDNPYYRFWREAVRQARSLRWRI